MLSIKRFLLLVVFATFPVALTSCDLWWSNDGDDLPGDGLVAHYRMDGDAQDEVGELDGEVLGAQPTENRFGEESAALRFDGENDYVRVLESGAFNFDLREASYTLSLWVRPDEVGQLARLLVKWDELTTSPYPFQVNQVADEVWASIYDGEQVRTAESGGVWDGSWKHIVVTYDADQDLLSVFVDAELVSEVVAPPGGDTRNDSPVYIGRAAPPREDRYFAGSIDDLRVYSRPLEGHEVEALYNERR